MPVTICNLDTKTGYFELVNEDNIIVGSGRARASEAKPGMVTLFFGDAALSQIKKGLRVPIDWVALPPTNEHNFTRHEWFKSK